jgi:hypothetical protein
MKWVTLEHIGVDRMASIWLIRRWIDPKAEFIFVPAGTKPLPKAEPFDIPGTRYSHQHSHCTFYTLLKEINNKSSVRGRIVIAKTCTVRLRNKKRKGCFIPL